MANPAHAASAGDCVCHQNSGLSGASCQPELSSVCGSQAADKLCVLSCLLPMPTTVTSHYTVKNTNRLIAIHTAFVCSALFSCLLSYLDLKQWEKKVHY